MVETTGSLSANMGGRTRLLGYEHPSKIETIFVFKQRIEEQIAILRIAIQNDGVNDVKTAENFAKKAERFLSIPFLSTPDNYGKKVDSLKFEAKKMVAYLKELSLILDEWITVKRNNKVVFASRFTPFKEKARNIHYDEEVLKLFSQDLEFLNGVLTKYRSMDIIVGKLHFYLNDKEFLRGIECKSSWKVETLKGVLLASNGELEEAINISEILKLPFFTKKRYLTMTVKDFRAFINIQCWVLKALIEYLENKLKLIENDRSKFDDKIFGFEAIFSREMALYQNKHSKIRKPTNPCGIKGIEDLYSILDRYDVSIKELNSEKKSAESNYSLYRFGQGLIEADIFDSLYK